MTTTGQDRKQIIYLNYVKDLTFVLLLCMTGGIERNIPVEVWCFYSLAQIFVDSTKCIDPWVIKFVVSNITGNNQWEDCIRWIFIFVV
jgi:hypothetical protein